MTKTTPPPRVNVLEALPELANQIATTTRLHPRRGEVLDPAASKIAGIFLWPEDEAWPTVPSKRPTWLPPDMEWDFPDGTPIELIPVLQLNKRDVPDFPFPEGKDLFQMLWLPLRIEKAPYQGEPYVHWRSTQSVGKSLSTIPLSLHADDSFVPKPCSLSFEHVQEFPDIEDLSDEQQDRLSEWLHKGAYLAFKDTLLELNFDLPEYELDEDEEIDALYQYELSVCPSNKLGGHVDWIQYSNWPNCDCGRRMEHLLTLTDTEVGIATWRRWLPLEDHEKWHDRKLADEILDALGLYLGSGSMYYFICRHCESWPMKAIYQR
jgi:hypothetical protein